MLQKAHIPQSIMDVIQGKTSCEVHNVFDIVSMDYKINISIVVQMF